MNTGKISLIKISEKYEDRPFEFAGLWDDNGWKFKIYKITHKSNTPADEMTFDIAKDFAHVCIAKFTELAPAYGLGYLILHNGMDSNFIVVNFWVGENMLRTHTMISQLSSPYNYVETTHTGMNVCVWDAQIHIFERNLWVECVLSNPEDPDIDNYLASTYSK